MAGDQQSRARRLVTTLELPEYPSSADRISKMDADIRDAAAKAKRSLEDQAAKYTVSGWSVDENGWEMVSTGRRIVLMMRLVRNG